MSAKEQLTPMTLHSSRSDSSIEVHTMLACRQKMYLCRDTSITHACVLCIGRVLILTVDLGKLAPFAVLVMLNASNTTT